MKLITEFVDGERITGQFLVGNTAKCVNTNGSAYLNLELRDSSGSINAKKWDATLDDEKIFVIGSVVEVTGEVLKYKEALQIKILTAAPVPVEEIDASKFMKEPPISKEVLIERFTKYVESIKNADCSKLLKFFIRKFNDKLFVYPAGVSVHHEYSSGLLMHITTMASIADFVASTYQEVDRDLLITGVLLHDLGKLIELEGPAVFKYTKQGRLLGHISIMSQEIKEASDELGITSEVPLLLEHMILSHHNEPEFGSPVAPMTIEAQLLSYIDNLDSKMALSIKALDGVAPGEFSQKVYALDGRCLYKHK